MCRLSQTVQKYNLVAETRDSIQSLAPQDADYQVKTVCLGQRRILLNYHRCKVNKQFNIPAQNVCACDKCRRLLAGLLQTSF